MDDISPSSASYINCLLFWYISCCPNRAPECHSKNRNTHCSLHLTTACTAGIVCCSILSLAWLRRLPCKSFPATVKRRICGSIPYGLIHGTLGFLPRQIPYLHWCTHTSQNPLMCLGMSMCAWMSYTDLSGLPCWEWRKGLPRVSTLRGDVWVQILRCVRSLLLLHRARVVMGIRLISQEVLHGERVILRFWESPACFGMYIPPSLR